MNLIDRYVAEVGRYLPEKSRADIEKEIRSTLEDMLEDRSRTAGRPVDDDMIVESLKEFGHPRKVASSYLPEQYLIGPQLYPYFLMVLKISLVVAFGVALVNLSIGIVQAGPETNATIQSIVEGILKSAGIAINIIGNVVLIFAVIERVLPNANFASLKEASMELEQALPGVNSGTIPADWDPRSLPEKSTRSERISMGGIIAEIVFTTAAILIFNFYPQILGIGFYAHGTWTFIPLLSSAFFNYLPWFNLAWGLEIVKNIILLRQGRWQPATRWFSVLLDVFRVGILYAMLQGPSIIGLTAENLHSLGISNPSPAALVNLIAACVNLGLIVAILAEGLHLIQALYQWLIKDRQTILPLPE